MFLVYGFGVEAQQKPNVAAPKKLELIKQVVETSCGQCKFNMKGEECNLAVRINGKAYFVDGVNIDDHGDAHAKDGFCQRVRKAEVSGLIVGNRFKATSFRLLPETKGTKTLL